MKTSLLFIIVLILSSYNCHSQTDTIYTLKNETIICKITKKTSMNIFYTEKGIGKTIAIKEIKSHSKYEEPLNTNTDSNGQIKLPIDSATGKIMFAEKIKIDSVSKDELFNRASTWFVKRFNSSKDVIQKTDKAEGVIIGKALFMHYMTGLLGENIDAGSEIRYVLTINVKDGKYKYELTDFIYNGKFKTIELGQANTKTANATNKYWNRARQSCLDEANAIITSLKEAMKKTTDW